MSDESGASSTGGDVEGELERNIGLTGALAIGVGTMIAAGIFVLSGLAVGNVGTVAIVSFLIAALVAALTAASYAEFSSIYHESGGGYMFVSRTFDTDLTYIMGWTMILGYPASAAFYIASFSEWFFEFVYPALSIPQAIPYWVSAVALLALLIGMNLKGTEESIQFQIAFTAIKILLLLLFLYGGLQAFDPSVVTASFVENADRFAQIGLTSALVFITFFGFSAITTNAEEIKDPSDTIPKAIYISMGLVTILYTLVVLVIVIATNDGGFLNFLQGRVDLGGLAPAAYVANHGETSMGLAAQYYLGRIGFWVVIGGALISMLSAANATILAGSRVKLAMARRNHLPGHFEDIHSSWGTPYKTVLFTGALILTYIVVFGIVFYDSPGPLGTGALFGLNLGIQGITSFANVLLLTGLTIVNVALIASRRRYPDVDRGFEVPFVPYLPAIAVVANVLLLFNIGLIPLAMGLIAEGIGVLAWFGWVSRAPGTETPDEQTPTVASEHAPESREYEILVPVINMENVERLMRTATDIAADNDGEVLVMSAVTVPEQTPLREGRNRMDDQRAIVNRALDIGAETDVPVSGTIRIGHEPETVILNTVESRDSEAVLMGWGGQPSRRRDVVVGSTVDDVLTDAPCDVFVERVDEDSDGKVDSILVPTAGGPHAELAAETSRTIARSTGATLEFVYVVDPDDPEDREKGEELLEDVLEHAETDGAETTLLEGEDVTETIVAESEDYDLTVIGATRSNLFERLVLGEIPQQVGERAENTVIMTKRNLKLGSWLRRQFDRVV